MDCADEREPGHRPGKFPRGKGPHVGGGWGGTASVAEAVDYLHDHVDIPTCNMTAPVQNVPEGLRRVLNGRRLRFPRVLRRPF